LGVVLAANPVDNVDQQIASAIDIGSHFYTISYMRILVLALEAVQAGGHAS
jgi:hypothetical protein